MNQISNDLFNELNTQINNYPEGIVAVSQPRIKGLAFFPGGDGLYKKVEDDEPKFPIGGIMILGQDFDNQINFEKSKLAGSEMDKKKSNATWRNLLEILNEVNSDVKNKCFYTNAIMGLRSKESKNTGKSIAFKKGSEKFLEKNREFFLTQLRTQKPKAIIGLGGYIPMFLSSLASDLSDYNKTDSLKDIGKIHTGVKFKDIAGYQTDIGFITHPSMYYANVWRRNGNGKIKGIDFEFDILNKLLNKI